MVRRVKKDRKLIEEEEKARKLQEEKKESEKKEREEVKPFTSKSIGAMLLCWLFGTVLFPTILGMLGINYKLALFIGTTFITSFGFVWVRFFISSKKGYCKEFWIQYAMWIVMFAIISYFLVIKKK